jgi:hypothetical protein
MLQCFVPTRNIPFLPHSLSCRDQSLFHVCTNSWFSLVACLPIAAQLFERMNTNTMVAERPHQPLTELHSEYTRQPVYSGGSDIISPHGELAFWPGVNVPRFLAATVSTTFIEQTATYPFEVIKTRLQVSSSNQGFFAAFHATGRGLVREFGWQRGLFRGLTFTVLTSFPVTMLYYGAYNSSFGALMRLHEKEGSVLGAIIPKAILPAAASALADFVSALAWVPQDQVSNRLMLGENPPIHNVFRRDSASRAIIRDLYCRVGVGGFYRGFWASISACLPQGMIWWMVYEEVKVKLESAREGHQGHEKSRGSGGAGGGEGVTFSHGAAGAAAGFTASTLTNPLDVAKTRIQTGRLCYGGTNTISVLSRAIKHEGFALVWKGLFGRVAVSIPSSIFHGACYEAIMGFCQDA